MLIANKPFLIPRSTSQFVCTPAYEKPLLQLQFNTNGDRATWLKELTEWPPGTTPAAKQRERHVEAEATRLAATYGYERFRKVYPLDEMFVKAFEACQTVTLPGQAGDVPDAEQTTGMLIADLMALKVPMMTEAYAAKIVEAGHTVDSLPQADAKGLAAKLGLNVNLIRSTIEAAKLQLAADAAPRAPSAPTQFKPTVMEPVPA